MTSRTLLFVFSIICLSCHESNKGTANSEGISFDKNKWAVKKGEDYPYRDSMLNDIIESKLVKGLKTNKVIELLGEPERIDTNFMFYRISQERLGFWPLHTKTLVLELGSDSIVKYNWIHK